MLPRIPKHVFRPSVGAVRCDMLRKAANTFNNDQAWDFRGKQDAQA
jgi:hypothetical protein